MFKKSNHIKPLKLTQLIDGFPFFLNMKPIFLLGTTRLLPNSVLHWISFSSSEELCVWGFCFFFFCGPSFHQYDYFFLEHISFSHPIPKHVSIFYLATSSSNSLLYITWESIFKPLIRQRIMQLKSQKQNKTNLYNLNGDNNPIYIFPKRTQMTDTYVKNAQYH